MKHSFRLKIPKLKSVFTNKLKFKTVSIENGEDVFNSINTILTFSDLDAFLVPVDCNYSFINNQVVFSLEFNTEHKKKYFFESIRKFEDFIQV